MSNVFLGQIKLFGCNFAPRGFAFCNGQLLPIAENDALYALIGTTYGGDGITTFGLPNLQGRAFAGAATNASNVGLTEGVEQVVLSINELPAHSHRLTGTSNPNAVQKAPSNPTPAVFGPDNSAVSDFYAADNPSSLVAIAGASMTTQGGSQPHENMQPYLVMNYCIAIEGIFPSRN